METIWGVDLGGTKLEGVVLANDEANTVLKRLRIPTEADKGYDHILRQIRLLITQLTRETGQAPSAIGFGTPGVLDPQTQTMKNCNTVSLNGQPLQDDLTRVLGVPVVLANDANCFALAETKLGSVAEAKPGAEVVFGVIMGTGVGGGVVVNGRLLNGHHGIAGEWGHNFLDVSGGPCYCGRVGCVETILSGKGLERYYTQLSGKALDLKEIHERHRKHIDPYATATMQRLAHFFGQAISVVINILDPDVIVLGGGVGNVDLLYTDGVAMAEAKVFNNRLDTLFLKPKLGDSAGVFGAAMLVAG
ncbi:Sugar kinase of the NBD/HSP70 family, may contain an N-terminal HTH domain [Catalinimonas alkaloidigena]|uniref:Sugar kinase of the NBD/HSP70 family, may contain an N-terminal HTH domain n=1 Tax=Catalinimonas alkaloidigena TaxID=1075417 RepID=A0A1G8XRU7_9BACT|nr:ROK family protein [Catalinimonas alkaloidigena]SDJ93289.1 Sugar kinase of the NBD/HSP70 family, may contain an N-terminal HTH domain [Catalinimonas alkaloidigena]